MSLRYAFVGAVEFSARCLEALLSQGVKPVAILCPDNPAANADYLDLGPVARRHGQDVRYFKKIARETEFLKAARPDVIFVLGLSQILPPELLAIPRLGCIGSHPALLPSNRGRHPIVWALANGLTESGITLFWLDQGVDSGDIWKQRRFPIDPDDRAGDVYEKVCALAVEMLKEGIPELEAGTVRRLPQDATKANYWRKRDARDGEIDWRMSSRRIHDLIRALAKPYPGAHCLHRGQEVKIWRARVVPADGHAHWEPGKVLRSGPEGIVVKTGDGAVELIEHAFPEPPPTGEYIR